jgi:sporulation protein YlmC with PRC-barrel domain
MSAENRLSGRIDGVLHLLDRQLVDSEGALLGKVDDVELSGYGSEPVVVLGILTGPAALLGRFGGKLGDVLVERWGQMRVSEPDRKRPWRIDIADVERLDSALHLSVRRDGVLRRDHDADHRLGRLTGMDVLDPDGPRRGRVLDARFEPDEAGRLVLCSLIVGRGRPGSMLGYDRRAEQGPWLVRIVVRWLHRHSVIVAADDADIDWAGATVRLRSVPTERPAHPFSDRRPR